MLSYTKYTKWIKLNRSYTMFKELKFILRVRFKDIEDIKINITLLYAIWKEEFQWKTHWNKSMECLQENYFEEIIISLGKYIFSFNIFKYIYIIIFHTIILEEDTIFHERNNKKKRLCILFLWMIALLSDLV